MEDSIYVTEVAERESMYLGGCSVNLDLWADEDADTWWKQFNEKTSFTFRNKCFFNTEGERLFWQLKDAIAQRDEQAVREILPKMKEFCQTNYRDLDDQGKWEHFAVQMPQDIGGPKKPEIREFLTKRAKGKVLETMCGFNSYFEESPEIKEVIALDFCRAMLERYLFPQRTRILYDLERIVKGEKMDFFCDGKFQTIGCWGSNYLSDSIPVFREFRRILSDNGTLLILESTSEGYNDLVKRYFKPKECAEFMQEAGFSTDVIKLGWLKTEWEVGHYYLVEGVK